MQGFKAATIAANGTVQLMGTASGIDSTATTLTQDFNWFVPHSSIPSGLNELMNLQFSVYLNPADDYLEITGLAYERNSYVIIDQLGALVSKGDYTGPIDIQALSHGLYHVQVQSQDGAMGSQRFLKK